MDGGNINYEHAERQVNDRCIELVDGNLFDPLAPDPSLMTLEVIAAALANNTRFAGQAKSFYSIAQHSVLVGALSPQDMAAQRCALLHDADECFGLPDLPTPVKPHMPDYVAAQKRIGAAVDGRYGISEDDHKRTKPADRQALLIEKHALKNPRNAGYWNIWSAGVEMPSWVRIDPLPPEASMELILSAMDRVFEMDLPISAEWLSSLDGFDVDPEFEPTPMA